MIAHRHTARLSLALVCLASAIAVAEPETVALLPLDADARLEVYGQPVATEIAKTLREGTVDVVVLGKGTPPPTTKLIVFGSLASIKGGGVLLQLRTRTPFNGTPLDTVEETATNLTTLTAAATKLAQKLLPIVKSRLAALHKPDRTPPVVKDDPTNKTPPAQPVVLVGIGVTEGATLLMEPLRQALSDAVGGWVRANNRQPSPVDASVLGKLLATQTVATAKAERGIVFEILDYEIEDQTTETFSRFPLARARVRVRIAEADKIVFDRVISTDTIVGDRAMRGELLAARVAREVLTILRPHMKRLEKTWR